MKKENGLGLFKIVFIKYFSSFFITLSILILLLFLCALIPQKKIYNNIIDSLKYYYNNQKIGYLNNTNLKQEYYRIDYSTDIKSILMTYLIDENKPISSIIEMNYYIESEYGLKDFSNLIKDNNGTIQNYSRYWQGQTIYLRSLLTITTVENIYLINIIILGAALTLLLVKLFKKDKVLTFSLFLGTIAINLFIVPFCLNYFFSFLISFIISLIVIKKIEKSSKNIGVIFMITGMLTSFFDFLTCETITLTLPLFIYIFLMKKNKKEVNFKMILKYIILWFIGYSSMFLIKWLIDIAFFGKSFLNDLYNQASIRVYDKNHGLISVLFVNCIKIIKCIFPFNKINYSITIFAGVFLLTIHHFIYNFKEKKDYLLLIIISIIPLLRFIILSAHTYRHYFFVYRALLPLLMVFIIFYVNLLSNVYKKYRKKYNK